MDDDDYWRDVGDQAYAEYMEQERLIEAFNAFGVDYFRWQASFVDPGED